MLEINEIYHEDCLTGMKRIDDRPIDCILTDPPYLYLKNQKLDRPFDETVFFNEVKRVLKKEGFIVLFGRGTSFYRWNTILANLGFTFKEEIVWDKRYSTSPVLPVSRKHELVCIFSKGNGKINRVKVDFQEIYRYEPQKVEALLKRLAGALGNKKSFDLVRLYYEKNEKVWFKSDAGHAITRSKNSNLNQDRACVSAQALDNGLIESSIISLGSNHYNTIHPTQKPVRLFERLLALVSKDNDVVLDPFLGSGTTAIAALNTGRNFIGFEIDEEYYNLANTRLKAAIKEKKSNLFSRI
jgi:site-specific DNA-methyltransferase (adenine-specific)